MPNHQMHLSGVLAALLFSAAVYALGFMIENYSHIAQTVSEIGREGSPAEIPWRIANLMVAASLFVFAWSIRTYAKARQLSSLPAWFVAFFALSLTGMAVFATPHPLHNIFGLSALAGYMSPLILALSWRRQHATRALTVVSGPAFILIVVAITLNLSPLFAPSLYPLEYYGVVQRSLLVAFYGWCVCVSLALYISSRRQAGLSPGAP